MKILPKFLLNSKLLLSVLAMVHASASFLLAFFYIPEKWFSVALWYAAYAWLLVFLSHYSLLFLRFTEKNKSKDVLREETLQRLNAVEEDVRVLRNSGKI